MRLSRLRVVVLSTRCPSACITNASSSVSVSSAGFGFGSLCATAAAATLLTASQTCLCDAQQNPELAITPGTTIFTLKSGRKIGYKVDGKAGGIPVIAFHGMGSSRLTWLGGKTLDEMVPGSNVMLVAVDRPGYGDSTDPPTGYSYVQFALDVKELADHLNLTTFCVAGHSSGGPYALACAAVLKDRVTASAIICSDPPYAHPKAPVIIRDSDSFGARWYGLDPTDAVRAMRLGALASGNPKKEHAWKQGELGFVTDFTLERIPWSFRVEDITPGSSITFWVGTDDNPAMIHGAPFMHSLVPSSRLRIVSGGTHGFKSDPFHLANILSELESASSAKKGRGVSWWPF